MKIITRLGLAGVLAGSLALGGCSHLGGGSGNEQTWTLHAVDAAPAATGKVQVATEKNGNHDVKVEVKRLAPPEKMFDGTSTYVVWLKAEHGTYQNIGTLSLDKDMNGKLSTKTPFDTFDVLVTAETDSSALTPSGHKVMNTKVQVAT
jgi:hypothetical protein